jgi:hypothetical protein
MRKLAPVLVVVALVGLAAVIGGAGGAIIAGSGSARTSPPRPHTTVVTTVVTTNPAAAGGAATTPPTAGSGAATTPSSFLARCVEGTQAGNTLYPAATANLEAMCERLARGDQTEKRSLRKELCIELVNNLHVAGAARARDLDMCHAPS